MRRGVRGGMVLLLGIRSLMLDGSIFLVESFAHCDDDEVLASQSVSRTSNTPLPQDAISICDTHTY